MMFDLSKLEVCFIVGTMGQGGAERQLFYILKTLKQSGTRTRVLCLTEGEFWEERIRELGVPVTWVGQHSSRLARLTRIISVLRKDPPDILQSQHFYTNLYAVAAARALGLKELGAVRNDGVSEVRDNGKVAGYLSLRAPRRIAANSRHAINEAVDMGVPNERLLLLSNVVDTDLFRPDCGRKGASCARLVHVGRLAEQKRVDRFLSLLAMAVGKSSLKIKATIIGDGPQKEELMRQATNLGLWPGVVEFTGTVPDMTQYYRDSDILVLTSDWEGTPNVVLEAMASGLPVVATRVGGVPDIVEHGSTGFLFDSGDDRSLADSLLTLIDDRDLRIEMGRRARSNVEANHSLSRLPGALAEVYEAAFS